MLYGGAFNNLGYTFLSQDEKKKKNWTPALCISKNEL